MPPLARGRVSSARPMDFANRKLYYNRCERNVEPDAE